MDSLPSIRQNARRDVLPNFRNPGVTLRILLLSFGIVLLQAIMLANSWTDIGVNVLQMSILFAPVMLAMLAILWFVHPYLSRFTFWQGGMIVTVVAVVLTLVIFVAWSSNYDLQGGKNMIFASTRYAFLSTIVCVIMLLYFRLRTQVLSLALDDARLQVLRARIKPHFLFNAINAVLGIVRTQPKQAETALEDMADLFRMAMSDEQDLVPLGQEVKLSKQYLALENLRMGERLQVDWKINDVPDDALIPTLLLQPLLENAVYHGIEPLPQGGHISVELNRSGEGLHLKVENPCTKLTAEPHRGNMIALRNIRERLDLLFDVEARYVVERGEDFYRVEITFPYVYRKKERSA